MESHPSYSHSPGYNKPKACWDSESKSGKQHKEDPVSLGMRGGNGRIAEEENGPFSTEAKRMTSDGLIKTKTPATAPILNASSPLASATAKASPNTPQTHPAHAFTAKQTTVASPATSTTTGASTKISVKHATGIPVVTEGLTLSFQNTVTAATGERKLKSPSTSRAGELKHTAKNSPKNLQKTTSASHIIASRDLPSPKNLQKTASAILITGTDSPKSVPRATLSHIPRATSSPKLKSNPLTSLTVDSPDSCRKGNGRDRVPSHSPKLRSTNHAVHMTAKSQQMVTMQQPETKEKEKTPQRHKEEDTGYEEWNREKNREEGIFQDMQVRGVKRSDLSLQVESKCSFSSQDRKQLSPGTMTHSAAQSKESVDQTDTNVLTREKECDMEKRKAENRDRADQKKVRIGEMITEKREEKRKNHKHEEEEKWEEREMIRMDKEEKEIRKKDERELEKKTEKEWKKDRARTAQPEETESKNNNAKEREEKEDKTSLISKNFKNAATMTVEVPTPVRMLDVGMQTELGYVAIAVQATVEICSKSTATSPTLTPRPWSPPGFEPESLLTHIETSGIACVSLQNGLSPDTSSDSASLATAPAEVKPKFLGPPPYKSPSCYRPSYQHVCQIEIELRSQSSLYDSLAPLEVTVSKVAPTCHNRVLSLAAKDVDLEPKQVESKGNNDQRGPPPEVVWDEKGMTWEVYGAAVDMESLGFAIQSHLQRKIQEHERRIGTLRKSISLSEHSSSEKKGAKKNNRNIFRSLFRSTTCCLKTQVKNEVAQ